MLRRFIFLTALATLAAAQEFEFRKTRQLDLGPPTSNAISQQNSAQNILQQADPRRSDFVQPGYLPPEVPAAAQDDPVILKPTTQNTPTHHGRDLCTDPFHSFLCATLRPRRPITGDLPGQPSFDNSLFGANSFVEPSKVLAPPLNDLEELQYTTTTTTVRPTTIRATTRRPTTTTTTTRRPTTTTTRRPTTTTTTTTTTTERPIAPAPSNDFRSYLPPEVPQPSNDNRNYLPPENIAPAAAQQDPAIVKPDDDHHHPHHHGRDLCSDPFHSFLCATLRPRKRITGDLPNSLQGQNSFLNARKVRPEPEISPQPSNEIDRAYLPPVTTTTTLRTTTFRFVPQPSNEIDRAYLPPSTTRRPPPTTTRRPPPPPPTTTRRPPPPPPTTTRRPPPPVIRFRPEPSNEIDRAYLPPVTTTTTRRPTTTTRRPTTTTTTTTPQPIISQPSNEVDRAYLPPVAPQPSNVDNTYLPPIEPAAAQDDPAIAAPDHDHDHHHHHHRNICEDPFHSFLCVSPKPRKRITGDLPERFRVNGINPAPSNIDLTRVKPLERKTDAFRVVVIPQHFEEPAPSQQNDVKIPSPSNINEGYDYPKPENKLPQPSEQKEVIGYDYPKPSATFPTPTQGYSYPKPDSRLTLPTEIKEEVVGYNYPKPTTASPKTTTAGYSYPVPERRLPLPSETKEVIGYDYPKPAVTFPSPTTARTTTAGYSYPVPERKLPLPSETKEVIGYDYPKPTVAFPSPSTGYNYPKPEKKLSLPSDNKPVIGYDYPKPTVPFPPPTTTKGYDYPVPENKLTLPSDRQNEISKARRIANSYARTTSKPLPSNLQEARERLQKEKPVLNVGSQNNLSELIPVNNVEFPTNGELGVRFGERLKRRERNHNLLQTPQHSRRL